MDVYRIHRRCLAWREVDGRTDICRKSEGHTGSADPQRREHFDPSTGQRWTNTKEA